MEGDSTTVSFGYSVTLFKSTFTALYELYKIQPSVANEDESDSSGSSPNPNPKINKMTKSLVQQWLEGICVDINKSIKCQIVWNSFDPQSIDLDDGRVELTYGVTLYGSISQVYSARAALLKNRPSQVTRKQV